MCCSRSSNSLDFVASLLDQTKSWAITSQSSVAHPPLVSGSRKKWMLHYCRLTVMLHHCSRHEKLQVASGINCFSILSIKWHQLLQCSWFRNATCKSTLAWVVLYLMAVGKLCNLYLFASSRKRLKVENHQNFRSPTMNLGISAAWDAL
jgi:hypothetical protein